MPNAYYTVDGVRDGICVVAGTGASGGALVGGKLRQVGGWGHLIDDAGSGFDVGRDVYKRQVDNLFFVPFILPNFLGKSKGKLANLCLEID